MDTDYFWQNILFIMEVCPYHHIEPNIKAFTARESIDETYIDECGKVRRYVLPELVVYKIVCPLCAESRSLTKFGKGYSAASEKAAAKRWNSACLNEKLKLFKNAVKTGC